MKSFRGVKCLSPRCGIGIAMQYCTVKELSL